MRKPLTYKLGGPEMFAAEFARLTAEVAAANAGTEYTIAMNRTLANELAQALAELAQAREQYNWKHERAAEAFAQRDEAIAEVERLRERETKTRDALDTLLDTVESATNADLHHHNCKQWGRNQPEKYQL